jgi:hypothetical protein
MTLYPRVHCSPGAMAGDHVVVLKPEQTRGREVSYVVEAKGGPVTATAAKRELETAIRNRGAVEGVLVFDGLTDAPLGGRSYLPHGEGRFMAVRRWTAAASAKPSKRQAGCFARSPASSAAQRRPAATTPRCASQVLALIDELRERVQG